MVDLDTLKLAIRTADPASTVEDDLLDQYEAAAVAYVERATGRSFGAPAEIVETLDGTGGDVLWLKEAPLDSPALVVESRSGTAWETLDVAETPYETDGRELYRESLWPLGRRNVRVTYTAGYEAGLEPADIRQAVLELVARMYEYRTPIISGTIVAELPTSVRDTLAHWRRIAV